MIAPVYELYRLTEEEIEIVEQAGSSRLYLCVAASLPFLRLYWHHPSDFRAGRTEAGVKQTVYFHRNIRANWLLDRVARVIG